MAEREYRRGRGGRDWRVPMAVHGRIGRTLSRISLVIDGGYLLSGFGRLFQEAGVAADFTVDMLFDTVLPAVYEAVEVKVERSDRFPRVLPEGLSRADFYDGNNLEWFLNVKEGDRRALPSMMKREEFHEGLREREVLVHVYGHQQTDTQTNLPGWTQMGTDNGVALGVFKSCLAGDDEVDAVFLVAGDGDFEESLRFVNKRLHLLLAAGIDPGRKRKPMVLIGFSESFSKHIKSLWADDLFAAIVFIDLTEGVQALINSLRKTSPREGARERELALQGGGRGGFGGGPVHGGWGGGFDRPPLSGGNGRGDRPGIGWGGGGDSPLGGSVSDRQSGSETKATWGSAEGFEERGGGVREGMMGAPHTFASLREEKDHREKWGKGGAVRTFREGEVGKHQKSQMDESWVQRIWGDLVMADQEREFADPELSTERARALMRKVRRQFSERCESKLFKSNIFFAIYCKGIHLRAYGLPWVHFLSDGMVIVESMHIPPGGKQIEEARLPPERKVASPRGTRMSSLEVLQCTLTEAEMNHILQTFTDSEPPYLKTHLESQDPNKIRLRTVWFNNFTKRIGEDGCLVALCPKQPRFTCPKGFVARWLLASFDELHLIVLRLEGLESYPTEGNRA